jgi:hypothetical protein
MYICDPVWLFRNGDTAGLVTYCEQRYGATITVAMAKWLCKHGPKSDSRSTGLPSDLARAWLRNRIGDGGYFLSGSKSSDDNVLTVELHVFFLHINETAEQLSRLRGEVKGKSEVARSKLQSAIDAGKSVVPIDAVTFRMAGGVE